MSEFETITLTIDNRGVARLTLNRPHKHNSLNALMIHELRTAFKSINTDSSIRVVILTGKGDSFCAGGDLRWMREQVESDRDGRVYQASELSHMLTELNQLSKPVVARVNGQAYGGGIGLMAVCDLVISVDTATFAMAETRLGLIPATIAPFVVARIGEGATRQIALNGRPFDGREALCLGLVSEAVSPATLDTATNRQIDLFLQCAPGAISNTKEWIRSLAQVPSDHLIQASADHLADQWEEEEAQDGLRSFFEHHKPKWQDR